MEFKHLEDSMCSCNDRSLVLLFPSPEKKFTIKGFTRLCSPVESGCCSWPRFSILEDPPIKEYFVVSVLVLYELLLRGLKSIEGNNL